MRVYYDFIYRRRLDVAQHGGQVGPADGYMPIAEAWRSGRTTTKPRDYILAVFPDIAGYLVPSNPRKLSLNQLVADAYTQFSGPDNNPRMLAKISKSMVDAIFSDCQVPWAPKNPTDVTEALGSILMVKGAFPLTKQPASDGVDSDDCPKQLNIQPVRVKPLQARDLSDFSQSLAACEMKTDLVRHATLSAPTGPLLGSDTKLHDEWQLLHRLFAFEFGEAILRQCKSNPNFSGMAESIIPSSRLVQHVMPNYSKLSL